MPAILPEARLAYFFAPKVACTSLKTMFFELENGHAFRPYSVSGNQKTIHSLYGTAFFDKLDPAAYADMARFALVRDPLSRVVSCYRNRVGGKKMLEIPATAQKLDEMGISGTPTLSEFVQNLRRYRRASKSIRHHSNLLSVHLGPDPDYYTRVFPFSDLDAFVAEIGQRISRTPELPHLQTIGSSETVADLSAADISHIKTLFAEDYDIYGRWF